MYIFLSLLTGMVLSVMIAINGNLTSLHGMFWAAVIIHLVGSVAAFVLCKMEKEQKPIFNQGPIWMYLGGAVGLITTMFQNFAFGKISVTGLIALGLLGQTITSIGIDYFGLFNGSKRPFFAKQLPGLLLSFAGIFLMMDTSVGIDTLVALVMSFSAGITVVISRMINARLAQKTSALRSSFAVHITGLSLALILALLFSRASLFNLPSVSFGPAWMYMGGMLGVIAILLCNITVPNVPAFRLTLLTFIGQVLMGVVLDAAIGSVQSSTSIMGGIVIAAGLLINSGVEALDRRKKLMSQANQAVQPAE
ncbi:DMT family transporter [Atopobium fossor]|uniref:DMT family transporter n=1 Tax=Atopobium fossor TaxID=39487 RepID=UPI00041901B8|nr:DMT family transporter [Atopobium fossor]